MNTARASLEMENPQPDFKAADKELVRLASRSESPTLLVRTDGTVLHANDSAKALSNAMRAREPALKGLLLSAAASGGAATGRVLLQEEATESDTGNETAYEVAILPLHDDRLLITAREVSFETNLTRALLKSRDLYKDLMHCSADFGWETDASGAFTYVSPGGALGFSGKEMNGRFAKSLLKLTDDDAEQVFATRIPQRNINLRATDKAGERVLLSVACVPVTDASGNWKGARGVARDITHEHERDTALRIDQARQTLLTRIVLAIRSEADPMDILKAASAAAAKALRAESAWSLRLTSAQQNQETSTHAGGKKALCHYAHKALERPGHDDAEDAFVELGIDDTPCLVACAGPADSICGALIFSRDTEAEPWRAHEIELIHGIVGHLAIALKQAAMIKRLEFLSRIDDLTGLLNRRALFEEIQPRISHQKRSGRKGCFLYIDLDHFKQVNDRLGHAAGDAALRRLGDLLQHHVRVGDLAGRIGGDEFALWLEDTDEAGARQKAEALIKLAPDLRSAAGDENSPLSMSIGIASSDPIRWPTADDLSDAADHALYKAKRKGRSCIVIADEYDQR